MLKKEIALMFCKTCQRLTTVSIFDSGNENVLQFCISLKMSIFWGSFSVSSEYEKALGNNKKKIPDILQIKIKKKHDFLELLGAVSKLMISCLCARN